ncbi:putative pentatricopeptide repeat-containing protein [Forsythia ovata]|uniref:Pentatricopeptide repeat-containing protein n=1 Tax=Forsythia ovata TaxID=205694 RepID=A0ABD1X0W3_9LAMI
MKARKMVPNTMHYTTLINGYCLHRKMFDDLSLFEEMKEYGLEPDLISYNVLVQQRLINFSSDYSRKSGKYDLAVKLFETVLPLDDSLCKKMCGKLITALCCAGDMKKAR